MHASTDADPQAKSTSRQSYPVIPQNVPVADAEVLLAGANIAEAAGAERDAACLCQPAEGRKPVTISVLLQEVKIHHWALPLAVGVVS